eukprot:TRINITY_DN17478_c0_g1_i1.p1 TRINITY_DN17478_c0_g1~~TRINITY_DN17478_c0_g1_i1.p1  ORF type:complete len:700 (-),score=131.53 TRINITY_DN17478_c0_g1_i1:449-2521(-)
MDWSAPNRFAFAPDERRRDTQSGGQGDMRCTACGCTFQATPRTYSWDGGRRPMCERCREAPQCAGCRRGIMGKYITASGKTYHNECFKCAECDWPIDGKYFMSSDGKERLTCARCHERSAPKCAGCGGSLLGKFTTLGDGRAYHHECFACFMCRQPISKGYFEEKDGFLCGCCREKKYPPKVCAGCKQKITGHYITVKGAALHADCFRCVTCRNVIEGKYFQPEDGPGFICEGCQPRCSRCAQGLGGRPTLSVEGERIHADCFTCCDCGKTMADGHYKVEARRYRCAVCHRSDWQQRQWQEEAKLERQASRIKRRNTEDFLLDWRPELVPCSRRTLYKLGVPEAQLPSSKMVCVCYNPRASSVHVVSAPPRTPHAAINISYLAVALRLLRDYGREPQFSLDPVDPHDIGGELQAKKFYPPWLEGSVLGEVLFQADYTLKELSFGDRSLPGLPDLFSDWDASEPTAARKWFVVRNACVKVSADGVVVPYVEMGVEARKLVPSANGYVDAPYTDDREPSVQIAKAISERFNEVAARFGSVGELVAVAKAMIVARFLLEKGCKQNRAVIDSFTIPQCPEGQDYIMQIPTLRKERRSSSISEQDNSLCMHTSVRSIYGGVDLGLPTKKVPMQEEPRRLLDEVLAPAPSSWTPRASGGGARQNPSLPAVPGCRPVAGERLSLLPLFAAPVAAMAA